LINPFAAAAGGYILLTTQMDTEKRYWHGWIKNLMKWFPWIPDGAIQFGWFMLHKGQNAGDEAAARNALLTAYQRGLPLYSAGVRWLLDGLTLLADQDREDGRHDAELLAALADVHAVARATDIQQPLTSIRLGGIR
jgi:hypothetical protein